VGLDAYVMCRCWQDGLTAPLPVDPALVEVDGDGWLGLTVPWEGNEALHDAFDDWRYNGCPHKRMELVTERVSNWAGVRMFQHALRPLADSYPRLATVLPNVNGGTLPPAEAAEVLVEIAAFRGATELGRRWMLVDEANGDLVATYVPAYEGVWILDGRTGHDVGIDPDGFFVRRRADGEELFRSMRFEQRPADGGVEFRDEAATARFPFAPLQAGDRLQVISKPEVPGDYAYIVDTLETLCRASVETGNPVVWT